MFAVVEWGFWTVCDICRPFAWVVAVGEVDGDDCVAVFDAVDSSVPR